MSEPKTNGKQTLLWINTLLTAIVLGGGGFLADLFWKQYEKLSDQVQSNAVVMAVIKTHQEEVLKVIPELKAADKDLMRRIDTIEKHQTRP